MKRLFLLFLIFFVIQAFVSVVFQIDKTMLEMVGMSVVIVVFWTLVEYICSGTKKKDT